jgi:hypothetical protein
MSQPVSVRLLLDEMSSPVIAAALRDLGHDVTAIAEQAGTTPAGLLFTSSRAFPRSRKNPGPLIHAIHARLTTGTPRLRSPKTGSSTSIS